MYGLCPWVWSGRVGHNRPVLEYACAVWHPALTKEQTQSLENVERRALKLFFGSSPCDLSFGALQMSSLCDGRREPRVIVLTNSP